MQAQVTLLDGAMGSELRDRGCNVPSHVNSIWSAQVLLDSPHMVTEVHKDYILAGAEIIIANNYAVTHDILARAQQRHKLAELSNLAMDLALQAKRETGGRALVAGSLPPLNTSYRADLVGTHQELVYKYTEILEVISPKADLIMIETMASSAEARGALEACQHLDKEVFLGFTLHGNRKNTLPSGEFLGDAIDAIDDFEFQALLVNCCASNQLTEALGIISNKTTLPYGGYANPERILRFAEIPGVDRDPEASRKSSAASIDIGQYLQDVEDWLDLGASIIGGCCRTKPEHIRHMKHMITNRAK